MDFINFIFFIHILYYLSETRCIFPTLGNKLKSQIRNKMATYKSIEQIKQEAKDFPPGILPPGKFIKTWSVIMLSIFLISVLTKTKYQHWKKGSPFVPTKPKFGMILRPSTEH